MANYLGGISGMGDHDEGALTTEQQSQLNDFKIQTRLKNEEYLRNHTEVSHVLQLFMEDVLTKRPENIREFAAEYFSDKELPNKVEEKRLENYLSNFKKPSVMEATSS